MTLEKRKNAVPYSPGKDVLPKTTSSDGPKLIGKAARGSRAAVRILNENDFDPIIQLITTYKKIEKEIEFYENWRAGINIPVLANGKNRQYSGSSELAHSNLYDKLIKIASDLLRYKYGRIPEGVSLNPGGAKPLTINLSKDQTSYEILVNQEDMDESD